MSGHHLVFAGGGTGGHLTPGFAVAEEWQRRYPDADCVFVGSSRPIERRMMEGTPWRHVPLDSPSLADFRRGPARATWQFLSAIRKAKRVLREICPAAVVGLGGFASVPVLLAARRWKLPRVLLEQNVLPGRVTRWLARSADCVAASFEESARWLPRGAPMRLCGNPVRSAILQAAQTSLPIGKRRTILVLGGSQGARALNVAVPTLLARIWPVCSSWSVVHQCGGGDATAIAAEYTRAGIAAEVHEFLADPSDYYREAGLVISRAGATTLAEIAHFGCPVVLVPYPAAADDHQRLNAESFASRSAAVVVAEEAGPVEFVSRLEATVIPLLTSLDQRQSLSDAITRLAQPRAAADVADVLDKLKTQGA
jgi:UDP-N-acetylglucosamine--N-acetylmuramyl-(pentapeptide) pyrophosphoryl-undecaprenol N-acetylglucosamine transferase